MDPKDEKELENRYNQLLTVLTEVNRVLERLNVLLPEAERLNIPEVEARFREMISKARVKAIRAVLGPQSNTNVEINEERICAELDKKVTGFFSAFETRMVFDIIYYEAKDTLKALMFNEADRLMPWRLDFPESLLKGRSLMLRRPVTECKYGGSPEGTWQLEGAVSSLEKLIRINVQDADPRTVSGELLRGVYHINQRNPWDKFPLQDPVFVNTKLYKNGKFELELTSGEMARNTAAFLFKLHEAKRAGM
jgi:hypothetical protein